MATPQYRFTSYDLDTCIEMAKAIQDGGGQLSAAALAHRLGYKSEVNGSFNTKLANARLFGLVEGVASALRPTQRALAILHPDYPAVADRARLEAFESVPLFSAVLDEYHGQPLPDETGLRNALTTRWQILPEKVAMVSGRLLDSAEQAGLFKVAGSRTKMIRPTFNGGAGATPPKAEHKIQEKPPPPPASPPATGARASKIIDGVLDMLPTTDTWNEQELTQWLAFFENALRLYYKLPSGAAPSGRAGE